MYTNEYSRNGIGRGEWHEGDWWRIGIMCAVGYGNDNNSYRGWHEGNGLPAYRSGSADNRWQ